MLAKDAASYVHAAIIREDASRLHDGGGEPVPVAVAAGAAGRACTPAESRRVVHAGSTRVFILRNVGKFPTIWRPWRPPSRGVMKKARVRIIRRHALGHRRKGTRRPRVRGMGRSAGVQREDVVRDGPRGRGEGRRGSRCPPRRAQDTVGTGGRAAEMAALAGLARRPGARGSEMLETGGEAHKAAAAAMGGDHRGFRRLGGSAERGPRGSSRGRAARASGGVDAVARSEADVARGTGEREGGREGGWWGGRHAGEARPGGVGAASRPFADRRPLGGVRLKRTRPRIAPPVTSHITRGSTGARPMAAPDAPDESRAGATMSSSRSARAR